MTNYEEHCPSEGIEEKATFAEFTERSLRVFKEGGGSLPQAKINHHIQKFRATIKALPEQVRESLQRREIGNYPNPLGADWLDNAARVLKGGSALDILYAATEEVHKIPVRADAVKRHKLIFDAIMNFKLYGGEISSGMKSPFGRYLSDIFFDAELEGADPAKAIQDYLKTEDGQRQMRSTPFWVPLTE
jgi:hypothetical protein